MREPENYLNYNILSYSGQEIDIQLFYKYHLEQDVEIKFTLALQEIFRANC